VNQKERIHETNWDVLIILDECRYDYFKRIYQDFFNGGLSPVESMAGATAPWFKKTFTGHYPDTVYVSANPVVNSMGIGAWGADSVDAHKKFHRVIDVWDKGWSKELNTTPPNEVTEHALKEIRADSSKRFIVHYLQPHEPYIPLLKQNNGEENTSKYNSGKIQNLLIETGKKIIDSLPKKIENKLDSREIHSLAVKYLGATPRFPEEIAQIMGLGELQKQYQRNLKLALKEVKKLVNQLGDREVVLTSDHGESIREKGWGHRQMKVPWLEVK